MIFGIGTDVVQIERSASWCTRNTASASSSVCCCPRSWRPFGATTPARFLAMRFAAKEAIVKAMGTGFAHGMWIRDIGVVSNAWGRPEIIWSERGQRMCEKLGIGEGHVTLTDEAGLMVAVAVLMRKVN